MQQWSKRSNEFDKRAAFALLWALAIHDKWSDEVPFRTALRLIVAAANDTRNFVKKAVNMALRAIGKRSASLNHAALETARQLAASTDPTARWIGKNALRDLSGPVTQRRLAARGALC